MMSKVFIIVASCIITALAAPLELPPGVPESCRYTYPNCPAVSLTALAQPLLDLHNANVALEALKAQQQATFRTLPAAFVPIVGPSGAIDQFKTEGPAGTGAVLHA